MLVITEYEQYPNMKERIDRHDDENVYQPKIHSDRIKELYAISQDTHLPMTVLVDYALRSYYNSFVEEKQRVQAEAEMNMEMHHEQDLKDHEFDDMDQWEDGSLFGF